MALRAALGKSGILKEGARSCIIPFLFLVFYVYLMVKCKEALMVL